MTAARAAAFALAAAACGRSTPATTSAPENAAAASATAAPSSAPAARRGAPCGALGCTQYDSIEDAFAAALEGKPLVVAVGEAHAQKDKEGVASSAKRFTSSILPALAGRASDLVVELMTPARLPDGGACVETARAVKEKQKAVTSHQAGTNQNEYLAMGEAARRLGVVPDLLRPTCEDLAAIDRAGDDMVAVSLETIARLTREKVSRLLDRNARTPADQDKMIVTYGGALHNDVAPAPERARWSFGPELAKRTGGRYVEIDLFVPEYIEDTDTWKKLEWYPHYDRAKLGAKVTVFHPREGSFVILFSMR